MREGLSRLIPFLLIAFLNLRILATYRHTKRHRIARLQHSPGDRADEHEERRLFTLLIAIIIIFFLCTIPAAPLTVLVRDSWAKNLPFQIARAVINLLEFTKFALNFYLYCLINPDIRRVCFNMLTCQELGKPARVKGQPVNPISRYTRSTRSTQRGGTTSPGREISSRSARGCGRVQTLPLTSVPLISGGLLSYG